ncbi:MAG: hypothetical protein ABIL01_17510 [Pseudomonadota bacterium]
MSRNAFLAAHETLRNTNLHIDRFQAGCAAFFSNPKHTRVRDVESEAGKTLFKVRFAETVPYSLNSAALDAVTNARDVLDNAVYASIVASGVTIRGLRKIKFPFGSDADEVANQIKAMGVDLNPAIADILIGLRPESRSKNFLWTINFLANSKKHRWNLVPFPIRPQGLSLHINEMTGTEGVLDLVLEWDATKNEITYIRISGDLEGALDTTIRCDLAFDGPETVQNRSALLMLRSIRNTAGNILVDIETECRRLGWVD